MLNIDSLRQIMSDPSRDLSLHLVKITKNQQIAMDGSSYQVEGEIIPEEYECLLTCLQNENLQGGIAENQIWLAGFIDNNLNSGFLIRQLINDQFKLHPKAKAGETVVSSLPKKKINLSNDHTAKLTENAVLGPELVKWMLKLTAEIKGLADKLNSLNAKFLNHTHPTAVVGPISLAGPINSAGVPPYNTNPLNSNPATPEKTAVTQLEQTTETDKFQSDLVFIQEKNLPNKPD